MREKLIFVSKALWIGGIETALVNLLNHFDYEKYDVTLLVLRAELDMLERIHPRCRVLVADREKTVSFERAYTHSRLFHLTEESIDPSSLHKMMMWTVPAIKWIENRLYIRYIRKWMREEFFDTCIIYSDVAAETAVRAIRAGKFLMFYHHGAMRHVYHDEIGYKKCDKIIAVSENQASELKAFVPKYAEKIIVIHNLTDVEGIRKKAAQPTAETFDETKFNIVSVGRVSHEKGMDLAIRACAKLVADGFDNIRWWIVGGGPAMREVQDTIAETHMEDYVITVGMQSNPYPYIRQADLYVQPSRYESFGLTIMEALILDKKVVSTDTFGAREILSRRDDCALCQVDVTLLADTVKKYMKCPELLQQAGSVSKQFEKENKAQIEAFENLL